MGDIDQSQSMMDFVLMIIKEMQDRRGGFFPFPASLPLYGELRRDNKDLGGKVTSTTRATFFIVKGGGDEDSEIKDILNTGTCAEMIGTLRNQLGITAPLQITADDRAIINGAVSAQIAWRILWAEADDFWRDNFLKHYVVSNTLVRAAGSGQILGAWRRVSHSNRTAGPIRRDVDFDFSPTDQPVCFISRSKDATEYRTPAGIKIVDQRSGHRDRLIALVQNFDSGDKDSIKRFARNLLLDTTRGNLGPDADHVLREGLAAFNGQVYLPTEELFADARIAHRRVSFSDTDFDVVNLPHDLDFFNPNYVVLKD